jgi:hypothetical protein
MNVIEQPLKVAMIGKVEGGTGPDLSKYPKLAYCPDEWGEGVRIASNAKLVSDVVGDISVVMDELGSIARTEGVTLDELFDAIRYARANGAV